MSATAAHWTELLRSDNPRRAMALVSARELREAVLEVGDVATRWALHVGDELAAQVGGEIPQIGEVSAASTTVRSAMQSSVLGMLIAIRVGEVRGDSMTEEARDSVRVSVESGIPLGTMLNGIRRGHALLVERLMQECRALASPSEQSSQFPLISQLCFDYVGRLADGLTILYHDEQQRWLKDPRAERSALVARILDGEKPDGTQAASILRYEIRYRQHLSICVWHDTDRASLDQELESIAVQFLRVHQASQTLITRQPDSSVLAWGNSPTPLTYPPTEQSQPPQGVRVAVGTPGRGLTGFRRTAYDAMEARAIVKRLPGYANTPTAMYTDVSLTGLLSKDAQRARRFVDSELGTLAVNEDHNRRLLETLAAYLDSHSPKTVARQLFIARNTVAYRLRKAEELLGRPITTRQPELRAAILLARAFHDSTEPHAPGP